MLKGHVMPAFTFEKLSPPTVRGAPPGPVPEAAPKKPRRLLGHMINRLVEARVRKNLRKKSGGAPQPPK
jgi:hypothetical protein